MPTALAVRFAHGAPVAADGARLTRVRAATRLVCAASVIVVAIADACGTSDAVAPAPASVAGSYKRRTINGHALPVPLPRLGTGPSATVMADSLVRRPDTSYTRVITVRATDGARIGSARTVGGSCTAIPSPWGRC